MLFKLVYQGTLGAQGLPLGVQVVGKPWNEELVLHVMKLLESNRKMYFPWFFYVDHCHSQFYAESSSRHETSRVEQKNVISVIFLCWSLALAFLCWIPIYPKSSSRYETSRVEQKNQKMSFPWFFYCRSLSLSFLCWIIFTSWNFYSRTEKCLFRDFLLLIIVIVIVIFYAESRFIQNHLRVMKLIEWNRKMYFPWFLNSESLSLRLNRK